MKTKANLKARRLGNCYMVVDPIPGTPGNAMDVYSFNSTAAEIWEHISSMKEFTADDIARFITENFVVDHEKALADAHKLINQWLADNLIEP